MVVLITRFQDSQVSYGARLKPVFNWILYSIELTMKIKVKLMVQTLIHNFSARRHPVQCIA